MKLRLIKGGPGSGRRPGSSVPRRIGPNKPYRSGVRPSELFPYGRNPDGTPRGPNDPRHAPKARR